MEEARKEKETRNKSNIGEPRGKRKVDEKNDR